MIRPLLLLLALCGCGSLSPEVGPPNDRGCADLDTDPAATVSFATDVTPLLADACHRCHLPDAATPSGVTVGGLDMTSYATLRAGGTRGGSRIVVAGRPCESVLVQKVGEAPPFGRRMPLDGPPFLDAGDVQLLHDWIVEGAGEG